MTTPTLAAIAQLEPRITGGIARRDIPRALAALQDASAWIRAEAGVTWLDDDGNLDAVPDVIVSICAAVARRIMDNPDGMLQESIAQYSYTRTSNTNNLYLTKQERQMIRTVAGTGLISAITLTSPYEVPWSSYDPVYMRGGYGEYPNWYDPA